MFIMDNIPRLCFHLPLWSSCFINGKCRILLQETEKLHLGTGPLQIRSLTWDHVPLPRASHSFTLRTISVVLPLQEPIKIADNLYTGTVHIHWTFYSFHPKPNTTQLRLYGGGIVQIWRPYCASLVRISASANDTLVKTQRRAKRCQAIAKYYRKEIMAALHRVAFVH